jgi:hypothetical protein
MRSIWWHFLLTVVFITLTNFLSKNPLALADPKDTCPETLIFDFKRPVIDRQMAIDLFSNIFSEAKGFPPFDQSMLRGPYLNDPAVPRGTYSYFSWYGHGEKKIGGLLYPDGRLVQRGYCK